MLYLLKRTRCSLFFFKSCSMLESFERECTYYNFTNYLIYFVYFSILCAFFHLQIFHKWIKIANLRMNYFLFKF